MSFGCEVGLKLLYSGKCWQEKTLANSAIYRMAPRFREMPKILEKLIFGIKIL